jgi:DNA-binding XRE family transcriptional regulator
MITTTKATKEQRTMKRNLNEERRAAGLSAFKLATLAGTREPRIYSFERDRYRPRTDEAQRIAGVLGVAVSDLFPNGTQKTEGAQ